MQRTYNAKNYACHGHAAESVWSTWNPANLSFCDPS